jgi:hypothetical protein
MKKVFIGFLAFVFLLSSVAHTLEVPPWDSEVGSVEDQDTRKYEAEAERARKQQAVIEKNRREPIDAIKNLTNEIKLLREAVERIEKKMPVNRSAKKVSFDPSFRGFAPMPAGGKGRF